MGIYAVFNDVKTIVQTRDPSVEFLLTAEAVQFQGQPPKIVWELPVAGTEEMSRKQLGPGYGPTTQVGRVLWSRTPSCMIHIWMAATGVDAQGVEYLDDNEDPNAGPVWLVQEFIRALHQAAAGQYELGPGGFGDRTMGNLGFLYTIPVRLYLGVFDTGLPAAVATVTEIGSEVVAEVPT